MEHRIVLNQFHSIESCSHNSTFADPVHAAVLAPGEAASLQVVRGTARAAEEEGVAGDHCDCVIEEAQDVLLPRVEGPQDCV